MLRDAAIAPAGLHRGPPPTIAAAAAGAPRACRPHPVQDADLLEEHEQAALIEKMERAAGRQLHYQKGLVAALGLCLAALYVFFALRPFDTPHQARFRGLLRAHAIVVADLGGTAMALAATLAVVSFPGHQRHGSWRSLLALAALLASLQAVFWSVAIYRVVQGWPDQVRRRQWRGLVGSVHESWLRPPPWPLCNLSCPPAPAPHAGRAVAPAVAAHSPPSVCGLDSVGASCADAAPPAAQCCFWCMLPLCPALRPCPRRPSL